jgi:hypothetical protein
MSVARITGPHLPLPFIIIIIIIIIMKSQIHAGMLHSDTICATLVWILITFCAL